MNAKADLHDIAACRSTNETGTDIEICLWEASNLFRKLGSAGFHTQIRNAAAYVSRLFAGAQQRISINGYLHSYNCSSQVVYNVLVVGSSANCRGGDGCRLLLLPCRRAQD